MGPAGVVKAHYATSGRVDEVAAARCRTIIEYVCYKHRGFRYMQGA